MKSPPRLGLVLTSRGGKIILAEVLLKLVT